MKKFKLFFSLSTIILFASLALVALNGNYSKQSYNPRIASISQTPKGIQAAMEYMAKIQGDFYTGKINPEDVIIARQVAENNARYKTGNAMGLNWSELGPDNVGGRTRAILFDNRDGSHNTMYAGGVGGGLWKSTNAGESWSQVTSVSTNLAIASIAQDPDGTIYVGTGEGLSSPSGTNQNTGQIGSGLYNCTSGDNFQIVSNPSNEINRLACTKINNVDYVFASTGSALKISTDKGLTWRNAKQRISAGVFIDLGNKSTDVKAVTTDNTVLAVVNNKCYITQDSVFTEVTPKENGTYISGVGRIEIAIAPSNTNYIYACVSNGGGALKNIYRSADRGTTWTIIAPGGSTSFNLFGSNNQGWYDNVIAVYPNNPKAIVVAGVDMWQGVEYTTGSYYNFTQITNQSAPINDPSYAHADHHACIFHPTDPNTFFIGTDGGIMKTNDGGNTFHTINRNYSVTQFYGLAIGHDGSVLGGTQDNSDPYIDRGASTPYPKSAKILWGGDGGWSAMSQITTLKPVREKVLFVTSQNAGVGRSYDNGISWQSTSGFFTTPMRNAQASFVTPMMMWQTVNNTVIKDSISVLYTGHSTLPAGSVILVHSKQIIYPFNYTLTAPLDSGKVIKIMDKVQSHYFIGLNDGIWMTDQPLNFTKTPRWYQVSQTSGATVNMAYSKDGDCIFAGLDNGKLVRVKNFNAGYDSLTWNITLPTCVLDTLVIRNFYRAITSIAVDPQNANNIIVTLGNYGQLDYVYASNNALSANPTFTNVTGSGLPSAPVYSSLIEMNHNNYIILGTEFGIYTTQSFNFAALSGAVTWASDNNGMNRVPVFQLRQQTMNFPTVTDTIYDSGTPIPYVFPGIQNYGNIYISTHGRGFWECDNFFGGSNDVPIITMKSTKLDLNVYPNPVMTGGNINLKINTTSKENVLVTVYDLRGNIVKSINLGKIITDNYSTPINCSGLTKGTYLIQVVTGNQKTASKFIVM